MSLKNLKASYSGSADRSPPAHLPADLHDGVALIMPVHGRLSLSAPALQGVCALSPAPEQIVVVTDVMSGMEEQAFLPAGAVMVDVPFASGPARARNAGATVAVQDILLFVDADVVIPPDTVQRVKEEFARNPEVAAIFGSYDTSPGDPDFLSQYRNLMHHFVHQRSQERAGTFWGGLGAIRTSAFRSVGGFDASYRVPCIEDIEFGTRLRDAELEIRLVKTLQGRHMKCWTPLKMLKTDLWQRGIPWMRLILARRRVQSDLNTCWVARLSTILAWVPVVLLPFGVRSAVWGGVALTAVASVVVLNLAFYRFLAQHRGLVFTVQSIPWHLIYYLECGLAGFIGLLLHFRDQFLITIKSPHEP